MLAHAGVASRRRAAELIESGMVTVDGRPVIEKGFRLDPDRHEILVNGRPLPKEEKKYYFLFNKPKNVISTVTDTHGRKKVVDYFKGISARLYPVGRLDKDTTGILIITNDGKFAHALAHPGFEIEKEYTVTVEPPVPAKETRKLERGVEIEGKVTAPCEIKPGKKTPKGAIYRVKLHEGRKRQIRLMFEAAGAKVVALKRTRYAGLTLRGLKEGEYRELSEKELERIWRFRPH